jgi:hypothetical protein
LLTRGKFCGFERGILGGDMETDFDTTPRTMPVLVEPTLLPLNALLNVIGGLCRLERACIVAL